MTAYFRNRSTRKVHRGFLRKRGARLFCGPVLLLQPGSDDTYATKGFEQTYDRLPNGTVTEDVLKDLCGRCSG